MLEKSLSCFRTVMFVIVAFDETNETEFVPVNWIADGTKLCDISGIIRSRSIVRFYWPPMKSVTAVSKAQMNCADPEVGWCTYNGRILSTASTNFI